MKLLVSKPDKLEEYLDLLNPWGRFPLFNQPGLFNSPDVFRYPAVYAENNPGILAQAVLEIPFRLEVQRLYYFDTVDAVDREKQYILNKTLSQLDHDKVRLKEINYYYEKFDFKYLPQNATLLMLIISGLLD